VAQEAKTAVVASILGKPRNCNDEVLCRSLLISEGVDHKTLESLRAIVEGDEDVAFPQSM
jgi:hypothetical protein